VRKRAAPGLKKESSSLERALVTWTVTNGSSQPEVSLQRGMTWEMTTWAVLPISSDLSTGPAG
jgi:hypothetical protein